MEQACVDAEKARIFFFFEQKNKLLMKRDDFIQSCFFFLILSSAKLIGCFFSRPDQLSEQE